MIRICEDGVLVVADPYQQRRLNESRFSDTPGTCRADRHTSEHEPHTVPTTAVQMILVADRDFVAAWAACA